MTDTTTTAYGIDAARALRAYIREHRLRHSEPEQAIAYEEARVALRKMATRAKARDASAWQEMAQRAIWAAEAALDAAGWARRDDEMTRYVSARDEWREISIESMQIVDVARSAGVVRS